MGGDIKGYEWNQEDGLWASKRMGTCILCGHKITGFVDDLSLKEYSLSGFCQDCQNEFFDPTEKR
tara:strand:- start:5426 stop:5620 length:195 start_codon:yes stop_codon:yes gene_type:complete